MRRPVPGPVAPDTQFTLEADPVATQPPRHGRNRHAPSVATAGGTIRFPTVFSMTLWDGVIAASLLSDRLTPRRYNDAKLQLPRHDET